MESDPGESWQFFSRNVPSFDRTGLDGPAITWVSLPDDLGWLMRPVMRDKCKMESLKDGTLDLADIALLNDALDVLDENERRYTEATKDGA